MRACASLCMTRNSRSGSSQQWLQRQARDVFVKERAVHGFVSRAAFKLEQLDSRRRLIRPGCAVLDLGAAPGGWTQVALRRGAGNVVSCDLLPHSIPANDPHASSVRWLRGDFTRPEVQDEISRLLGGRADVVLCDAAPDYGGGSLDHIRLVALAKTAAELAEKFLGTHGALALKVSRGGEEVKLRDALKKRFAKVEFVKPEASRQESSEIYLLAFR